MTEGAAPAGWYPDPGDAARQRWWSGTAWGEQAPVTPAPAPLPQLPGLAPAAAPVSPMGSVLPGAGMYSQPYQSAAPRQPWWRSRSTVIAAAVVLVVGIGGYLVVSGRSDSVGSVSTAGWTEVSDTQVGFTALLPQQPVDQTEPALSVAGAEITLRLAVIGNADGGVTPGTPPLIVIESSSITPAIPQAAYASNLREAIFSFAASSGFSLKSQGSTSFLGQSAWKGEFESAGGTRYSAIAFFESGSDLYMISTKSSYFTPVTTNFQPSTAY